MPSVKKRDGQQSKIGIIICRRYQTALEEVLPVCARGRAFEAYSSSDVEVVGFTTCGGVLEEH
jgi:hypothetical protein